MYGVRLVPLIDKALLPLRILKGENQSSMEFLKGFAHETNSESIALLWFIGR